MAVSAEISATVINTRAKSNMRKNWRIAADYSVQEKLLRRTALFFPFIAACVADPSLFVYRYGNASVRR